MPPDALKSSPRQLLLWALGRRSRVRVTGPSMAPTLRPGDHVLVDRRAFASGPPRVGDVVLARHPHQGDVQVIKRVAEVERGGEGAPAAITLLGDNEALSTDSREFGAVPATALLGRIVARFP